MTGPAIQGRAVCLYGDRCRPGLVYDIDACGGHRGEMCDPCSASVLEVGPDGCFWCGHGDAPGIVSIPGLVAVGVGF